jgi:hypothetical protein
VAPDRYDVALNRQALVHATIENHGNLPATGVVLRVAAVRRSEKTFGCPQAGCHVGAIPPGGSVTIDVFAADGKTGLSGVSVTASAREPDPTPEDARGAGQFVVLNCTEVGTAGADFLPGRPGDDRICGLPGPDWISGGKGDDHLDGGNGDDTIYGGPGHDTILGGGGRDVIFARDGERDRIDCGSEYDVAVVDKIDQVGHCERVLRK